MGPGIRQVAKSDALESATILTLAVLALSYYLGAQAAFYVGTLSDRIFAPFWPPNVILFCALLLVPRRRWWLCIAAAFPAHVVAEIGVGMGPVQLLVAFVTNCAVAVLNAYGVRRFMVGPDWFGTLRQATAYVLITVIVSPAVCALGGAFVPLLSNGEIDSYWVSWAHSYGANALAGATLGPVFMTWSRLGAAAPALTGGGRVEMVLMLSGLIGACAVAFGAGPGAVPAGFVPTLLYLPLPFVLWATIRFGNKGASAAIFVVTIVSVGRNLHGATLFDGGNAGQNVLALQAFLTVLSVPVLLLGAAIEQLRRAESRMQALAGGLLRVQDEERREVARQLHEGTGQHLRRRKSDRKSRARRRAGADAPADQGPERYPAAVCARATHHLACAASAAARRAGTCPGLALLRQYFLPAQRNRGRSLIADDRSAARRSRARAVPRDPGGIDQYLLSFRQHKCANPSGDAGGGPCARARTDGRGFRHRRRGRHSRVAVVGSRGWIPGGRGPRRTRHA